LVQRVNDAIIIATAETNETIDVLYTYDDGIKYFSGFTVNCTIKEPPHPFGALFEQAEKKGRRENGAMDGQEIERGAEPESSGEAKAAR